MHKNFLIIKYSRINSTTVREVQNINLSHAVGVHNYLNCETVYITEESALQVKQAIDIYSTKES